LTDNDERFFGLTLDAMNHPGAGVEVVEPFQGRSAPFFARLWAATEDDLNHVTHMLRSKLRKVVDVGSGDGRLVQRLAESGHDALGIEISQDMHERATARRQRSEQWDRARMHLFCGDFREIAATAGSVDVITSVGLTVPTFDKATRADFFEFAAAALGADGLMLLDFLDIDDSTDARFSTVIHRLSAEGELEVVHLDCRHLPSEKTQTTNLLFEFIAQDGVTQRLASSLTCSMPSREDLEQELAGVGLAIVDETAVPTGSDGDPGNPAWGLTYLTVKRSAPHE